jgi:hypothetical protein
LAQGSRDSALFTEFRIFSKYTVIIPYRQVRTNVLKFRRAVNGMNLVNVREFAENEHSDMKSDSLREFVVVLTHAVGELQLSRNESISLRAMLISPGS